jgi:hypothetical protein
MMCCAVLQGVASGYMGAVPGAAIRLRTLLAGLEGGGRTQGMQPRERAAEEQL